VPEDFVAECFAVHPGVYRRHFLQLHG
jgi:hypothetical protein